MRGMKARLEIHRDVRALSARAARLFVQGARDAGRESRRFDVALSGGSTPKLLYSLLAAEPYRSRIPWDRVHFFWSDERFVPRSHPDSNFRMAREALLDRVPVPKANVHPMPVSGRLAACARRYERLLRLHF